MLVKQYKIDTINPWNDCNICTVYDHKANNSTLLDCGSGTNIEIVFIVASKGIRVVAAFKTFL